MCGVIGFSGENNEFNIDILKKLILESQIRGKHSTGISYLEDNRVVSKIDPISSKEFIIKNKFLFRSNNLMLIGHTRYSTSDLLYNQPIYSDDISIVHNGVISQASPYKWEDIYGYKCEGKNDSELILRSVISGNLPLLEFFNSSSMSVIELHRSGKLLFYRNSSRPLWYYLLGKDLFIASTKDIFIRAFNKENILPIECKSNNIYMFKDGKLTCNDIGVVSDDLQIHTECSKNYLRRN